MQRNRLITQNVDVIKVNNIYLKVNFDIVNIWGPKIKNSIWGFLCYDTFVAVDL